MVRRGILLDIPALTGVENLAGGYEITPADLDAATVRAGVSIEPGDVVLIRSGWGRWFADRGVHAAGADTIAFECLRPGAGHSVLPVHRVLLVETSTYIIEAMDLEGIATAGLTEFLFILSPLPLHGATGSPVRPLAVV